MQRFSDYYEFDFLERINIYRYEKENRTKLYVTDSIDDIFESINGKQKVKYGKNNLIQIHLPGFAKVLMDTKTKEKLLITSDKRLNDMIKRYRKIMLLDYDDIVEPYVSTLSCFEFQQEPHMTHRFAINTSIEKKLFENVTSDNITYIQDMVFSHCINDPHPILQTYNSQISGKKKKKEKPLLVLKKALEF
ncbi:hypothetical protein C0585_04965 [Candidatus Woesearchaeota archaeon]|nr:MAG: hypothetical protein C0585_04965 [Candidatus Woesearchaeota archaeon]